MFIFLPVVKQPFNLRIKKKQMMSLNHLQFYFFFFYYYSFVVFVNYRKYPYIFFLYPTFVIMIGCCFVRNSDNSRQLINTDSLQRTQFSFHSFTLFIYSNNYISSTLRGKKRRTKILYVNKFKVFTLKIEWMSNTQYCFVLKIHFSFLLNFM